MNELSLIKELAGIVSSVIGNRFTVCGGEFEDNCRSLCSDPDHYRMCSERNSLCDRMDDLNKKIQALEQGETLP